MPRFIAAICVLLGLCPICASPAAAQQTVNLATLEGRVNDDNGPLNGAQVTARQTDTNLTFTAVTDDNGRFSLPNLPLGNYQLVATLAPFHPATYEVKLSVGSVVSIEMRMKPQWAEVVTVSDAAPVVETGRSSITGTIAPQEIRSLPINGRSFLDLALLVPGVSATNVGGGTQFFPETSAVPGVGLSIGSQRNLSNNFLVDGLSANDDAAALSGIPYSMDAIDQFQVITSGGQAELGRALGGYVNIVTKSGSNKLDVEFHEFGRTSDTSAVNPLLGQALPMTQNQYGAGAGGPIVKGRTFFYGNFEQRQLDQSGLVTVTNATAAVINARLTAVGYPGPAISTGVFANPVDTTNALAKVDHQINASNRATFRYTAYRAVSSNARGAGGLNTPSSSAGLDNLDQTFAFSNVMVLSSHGALETRAQVATSDLKSPPSDLIGPAVTISGVAIFGTLSGSPTARTNRLYQVVNNLSWISGAHSLRAGVDALYNDLNITFPRSFRGAYTFSNLANFLAGTYNNSGFTQTFGATEVHQTNPNLSLYAQDEWHVAEHLTLNAGLRYDLQWLQTIQTDTNNVSPRAGVTWAPWRDGKTVIRGSAGLFYDRVPLRAVANALLSAGNTTDLNNLRQINVSLSPTQTGAPVFPNILPAAVPTTTLVNFTTIDPHLQNAYSKQASIEFERQLWGRSVASIAYEHLRGERLLMQINQNVPTCAASGNNNGCRPNPNYANNNQYSSAGSSVYDGVHVSFRQEVTRWGSYRVSYTYSKAFNNVGEAFFNSPIDPTDLSKDWGRSDDDQRHRLSLSGTLLSPADAATTLWEHLSHHWVAAGIWQYSSPLPFNITSGVTTIQGTAGRPIVNGEFIPRNAGQGDTLSGVSLRLSRMFDIKTTSGRWRIEALVEAFNLLNTRNDIARVTVFGAGAYPTNPAPNYGNITVVGDPRSLQFGLRISY